MAQLATFTITKAGWLTNVADNVFAALLRDNPKLVWTVKSDDENLTCKYMSCDLEITSLSSMFQLELAALIPLPLRVL